LSLLCKLLAFRSLFTKIIKNFATRCGILRLKCTKFDFGWGAGGANSAPPDPLAGLRILLLRGEVGKGVRWEGEGRGRGGRERRGGGKGRREGEGLPPNVRDALTPL